MQAHAQGLKVPTSLRHDPLVKTMLRRIEANQGAKIRPCARRSDFLMSNSSLGRNDSVRGVQFADIWVQEVPGVGPDICHLLMSIQYQGKTIKNGRCAVVLPLLRPCLLSFIYFSTPQRQTCLTLSLCAAQVMGCVPHREALLDPIAARALQFFVHYAIRGVRARVQCFLPAM